MAMNFDGEAWSAYFKSRAASLNLAWTLAKAAYKSFRQVRVDLQLPIIDDSDGQAWSSSLLQGAADLEAMVKLLLSVSSDVISGRRGVAWIAEKQDFYIEKLPSDDIRIGLDDKGTPVLISTKTGQVTQAATTLAAPADESLYVASLRSFLLVEAACGSLRSFAEEKTLSTLGAYRQKLIDQGSEASAEQGKLLVHAIEDSSKGAYDAAAGSLVPVTSGGGTTGWSPTEKILLVSALATVTSVAIQVFKARSGVKD